MNSPAPRGIAAVLVAGLGVAALAGCGGGGGGVTGVTAVAADACGPLEYGGSGQPDVVIASDLPMQGSSQERSQQMVDAIRLTLRNDDWRAGDSGVALQVCDDTIAKTGEWDPATCRANAHAYADDADLVGVIGTYNSGCAAEIIPILNQAPGGGVAMVSPGNTLICLTQPADTCAAKDPGALYPSGERNYARVVPNDAAQGAALAEFAQRQGIARPYVLYAAKDPTSRGQATTFRNAAAKLGLDEVGFTSYDPNARDYSALMQKVKASGADGVILAGLLEQNGARLIEDKVAALGPNDGPVKLLAFDGFAQQATIDGTKGDAAGMFASLPGRAPQSLTGKGRDFVAQLQDEVGGKPVELFAPYAGEAAEVMLRAIDGGGGQRSGTIRSLFATRIEDGIVGSFAIEPSGDPSVAPITVSAARGTFSPTAQISPPPALVAAARG